MCRYKSEGDPKGRSDCDSLREENWRVHEMNQKLHQEIRKLRDGWIAVTERLPEEGVCVVVYSPGDIDGGFHACGWFVERRPHAKPFGVFRREDAKAIWGVTHWMPLPAPPSDGK
jgi:hypothetical protein